MAASAKGEVSVPLMMVVSIIVVVVIVAFAVLWISNTQNKSEVAGGNLIKSAGAHVCSSFAPFQSTICPSRGV
jgi:hypothetical protein